LEETGLHIEVGQLVGLYSRQGQPVVLAVYEGRVVSGELRSSEESTAVEWFPLDALPPLAFPHDAEILRDWLRQRSLS
jgi:8-oxo-dGTP diphosphatase